MTKEGCAPGEDPAPGESTPSEFTPSEFTPSESTPGEFTPGIRGQSAQDRVGAKAEVSVKDLSIVVPVLNEILCLPRFISSNNISLAEIASLSVEWIFVDGGSTDGSVELLQALCKRHSHCHLLYAKAGRGRQLKQGADCARGRYLLFLHADTEISTDFFGELGRSFSSDSPMSCWGYCRLTLSSPKLRFRIIENSIRLRSRFRNIATGDQGILVSSSLYHQVGGFKNYPLMEDLELTSRLKKICRPARFQSSVISSSRRWEKRGAIKTMFLMWCLQMAFYMGVSPSRLVHWYR